MGGDRGLETEGAKERRGECATETDGETGRKEEEWKGRRVKERQV